MCTPVLPREAVREMWLCVALLLWMGSAGCSEKSNTSQHIECTSADFYHGLHAGKIMFIYFQHQDSPTIALFLKELEKSAEALQDFGVLVGKVSCEKEPVPKYCSEENLRHTAFLFRGGREFSSFDLDTVFDVNSIVSEVLFAILREEVRYVHTEADLLVLEKASRGGRDLVLGYVRSLGTREHRSLMEAAYVYGSRYQFILSTGGPVLKQLGVNDSSPGSRVWFLHCRAAGGHLAPPPPERCPMTRMRRPLCTLQLHAFLQLMEAPLVSEVHVEPSSVPPPPFPYQLTPQVFLFSGPATQHLDRDAASTLAWSLRGLALLLLVHSSEVRYLTLHSPEQLLELLTSSEEPEQEEEQEQEEAHAGSLDDEVSASVWESGGLLDLDLDFLTPLTPDSLGAAVAQSSLTAALFYLRWDAVSAAALRSFIQVAHRLSDSGVEDVLMGAVDCGEWTDLCAAEQGTGAPFQPITAFPSLLLLRPQEPAQLYRGMLGSEALLRFILMSRAAAPALLSSQQEVTSFLQEVPPPRAGGTQTRPGPGAVPNQHTPGFLRRHGRQSMLWTPPLCWCSRPGGRGPPPTPLPPWSSLKELLDHIRAALLPPVPELTVDSLPSIFSLGKALLLLFLGEEEDEPGRRQNRALLQEMGGLLELGGPHLEHLLPCWIHLGRTPVGLVVLGSYLGSMPPLPALLLTHLPSGPEVYRYPPDAPLEAPAVLLWLQRVEQGAESPAGKLNEDNWPPTGQFLDFLKIMDGQQEEEEEEQEEQEEQEEEEEEDLTEEHLHLHSEL
ncbi:unnamed protein product [Menidia menidia]|uniref:(Atlantic silverside) hypothetical protein n=1 Tax=Menidia menidia TaxID=238744 RepID=A0A8S4BZQ6_9TELE|nr:unnamed protein product [Menidia menidia]